MMACSRGFVQIVRLLIEKYPQIIHEENNEGKTGFLYAC